MNTLFTVALSVACARRIKQCLVASIVAGSMSICSLAIAADAPDTIGAVWYPQQLQFSYHGTTVLYSCPELLRLVWEVLSAVGVRRDMRLVQGKCYDFATKQSFTIAVDSPIEANPENLRRVTTTNATQQLAARLRREASSTVADIDRFAASWKTIRLPATHCKLLCDISEQILPRLRVRPVGTNGCGIDTRRGSARITTLRVEALLPQAPGV